MPPFPSMIAITTPSVLHIHVIITREVEANIKIRVLTALDFLVEGQLCKDNATLTLKVRDRGRDKN